MAPSVLPRWSGRADLSRDVPGTPRIAAEADVDTLAPTLIGAGHLLFADRRDAPPEAEAVHRVVTTVIGGVVREAPA